MVVDALTAILFYMSDRQTGKYLTDRRYVLKSSKCVLLVYISDLSVFQREYEMNYRRNAPITSLIYILPTTLWFQTTLLHVMEAQI